MSEIDAKQGSDLRYREQLARVELLEIQVELERQRLKLIRDGKVLPADVTPNPMP